MAATTTRQGTGVLAMMLVIACGDADPAAPDATAPADAASGVDAADSGDPFAWCREDADGDTIPDRLEPPGDADGDGRANADDTDSDGDGAPDRDARRSENAFYPRECWPLADSDADMVPDAYDLDDDDDLLSDRDEPTHGLDPLDEDGDDDGCIDGAEVMFDGCASPRVELLELACDSINSGTVTYEIVEAQAALTLEVVRLTEGSRDPDLFVEPLSVTPAGAAVILEDRFEEVAAGAGVTFAIEARLADRHVVAAFDLLLRDAAGAVIERRVLVARGMGCPPLVI
jgi:hypothetical protein